MHVDQCRSVNRIVLEFQQWDQPLLPIVVHCVMVAILQYRVGN